MSLYLWQCETAGCNTCLYLVLPLSCPPSYQCEKKVCVCVCVFFFFTHLFTAAAPKVPVQWRSATRSAAPGRRSPPLGHATHGRALEPMGIREELVQSRLRSGSTDMGFAGQLGERRGKRSLRSHGNDTAPSLDPCVLRSGAGRRWRTHRPHAREHAEEGCGFRPPTSTPNTTRAAAASPAELRVRLPALAAGCIAEGNAGHKVSTGPWSSVTCNGADGGGVNCHL